ncbi:glycosyltransferase family 2 protein [Alkalihalophilus lindianensis]|uniref:Glycosyltransferase family 2 protein n=1 Tax=Alkalihalophilus lindianensis TaxID=1630542 RepID=A0ABU3XEW0_9BACI|nr:glycosyltransferase family 2 protein [Alkalihalophilus lindianensis]MDV2686420.1 glycosyltransferase family 2 protein [Alkalihalophilus lindianensis]
MDILELFIASLLLFLLFLWFFVRPMSVLVSGLFKKKKERTLHYGTGVSVIVPCHNEADTIEKTVVSILNQNLKIPLEVILIENNSTDNTYFVIQQLSTKYPQVVPLSIATPRAHNPISFSLNHGINHCKYDIVVRLDADTELAPTSIQKAIAPIINGDASTTATNIRLSNLKENLLTRLQGLDYYFSMELDRRSQRLYNGVLCCSGAMQVFKLSDLREIGGYNNQKDMGEDMEITFRMHDKGKVEMTPEAIAFTDVPHTIKSLIHQRAWWMKIGIVTTYMHKKKIGKKYGRKGMFGLVALPIKVFTTFQGLIGVVIKLIGALILSQTNTGGDFISGFLWFSILHIGLNLFSLLTIAPVTHSKQGLGQWYLLPIYSLIYQPFLAVIRAYAVLQGILLILRMKKIYPSTTSADYVK